MDDSYNLNIELRDKYPLRYVPPEMVDQMIVNNKYQENRHHKSLKSVDSGLTTFEKR